jgi:hypothetical protein
MESPKFTIDNLEDTICYPENTVDINRWGSSSFETTGYNNVTECF